ncbi:hypothetical protein, partial [Rhizobium leguminosarum]|uniref:hypothetical protein n=1 Tax=Rhizobium leguminosarum TaxID=384 RepID=UPI003F95031E
YKATGDSQPAIAITDTNNLFAAEIGPTDEIDQPFVTGIRRSEKNDRRQLDQGLLAAALFRFQPVSHVDLDLAADNRLQAFLHRLLGEV